MHLIPITQIRVNPNRQRRVFDPAELQDLVTSIEESSYGLLHPIVVRVEGGSSILVAGERRLRALQSISELGGSFRCNGQAIPEGMAPCILLGELSELDAEEAELEENIRRADLTWAERAAATARLMRLREAQADDEERAPPTVGSIAREVRPDFTPEAGHDTTRKELIVARYLDDPEVAKAPTLAEAFKVLKKKEETQRNRDIAERVGKTYSGSVHTLLNGDAEDWCAGEAAPETFDIILTDPPYGMGASDFGDSGVGSSAAAHFYDDTPEALADILKWFAPASFRLAKPQAHLYVFCDLDRFHDLRTAFASAGWKVHRTPLVWSNPDGFRAPWPKQGPQRKYELILYAVKGGKETMNLKGDVLEYRKDASAGHPAQKPVPLLIDLLRRSARAGDKVLDPFAGSGSTLVACHELKLTCTAIEKDASAYGIAAKRLQELAAEMELPL